MRECFSARSSKGRVLSTTSSCGQGISKSKPNILFSPVELTSQQPTSLWNRPADHQLQLEKIEKGGNKSSRCNSNVLNGVSTPFISYTQNLSSTSLPRNSCSLASHVPRYPHPFSIT